MKWKRWQIDRLFIGMTVYLLIAVSFLTFACESITSDRSSQETAWEDAFVISENTAELVREKSGAAVEVLVGTYIENIREISLRNSFFEVEFTAWYRWSGDPTLDMANHCRIYNGTIVKKELVKDYHDGETNYQLIRYDVKVSKSFHTVRFPLETHQLMFYIESDMPCEQVVFKADEKNSGLNNYLDLTGYDILRNDFAAVAYAYDNSRGDPTITDVVVNSEMVTGIEIVRSNIGLYIKCFIALYATSLWALIALYLCAFHHVDPLGMIPSALFGTVANLMVGANILPDALEGGLLEYVNIWGVITILSCAITIINVNRVRTKYEDYKFAKKLGYIMLAIIVTVTLTGHVLLPALAFMR